MSAVWAWPACWGAHTHTVSWEIFPGLKWQAERRCGRLESIPTTAPAAQWHDRAENPHTCQHCKCVTFPLSSPANHPRMLEIARYESSECVNRSFQMDRCEAVHYSSVLSSTYPPTHSFIYLPIHQHPSSCTPLCPLALHSASFKHWGRCLTLSDQDQFLLHNWSKSTLIRSLRIQFWTSAQIIP